MKEQRPSEQTSLHSQLCGGFSPHNTAVNRMQCFRKRAKGLFSRLSESPVSERSPPPPPAVKKSLMRTCLVLKPRENPSDFHLLLSIQSPKLEVSAFRSISVMLPHYNCPHPHVSSLQDTFLQGIPIPLKIAGEGISSDEEETGEKKRNLWGCYVLF